MEAMDISKMTEEQKEALSRALDADKTAKEQKRKEAYVQLRAELIEAVRERVFKCFDVLNEFRGWTREQSEAFLGVMEEYGQLKKSEQLGFTLGNDDFRFHMKGNRVKRFDERADMAAKRLVEFLDEWVTRREGGDRDPMYRLAMTMIERNNQGDLDYKSISRLYEIEADFNDSEYSAIMELFRESNVVEATVVNYYFEQRDPTGAWRKIELNFNKM